MIPYLNPFGGHSKVIDIDVPGTSSRRLQKAAQFIDEERYEDAIRELEDVVEAVPLYAPALVMLADAYQRSERDLREVRSAWVRARRFVPGSAHAKKRLRALRLEGRQEEDVDATPTQQEEPVDEEQREPEAVEPERSLGFDDIDTLISELETARIEPSSDPDVIPEPDLDDDLDDMVSPTLARIYAAQDQFGEAARIYRKLADQNPDEAEGYLRQAEEMTQKAAKASSGADS